MKTVCSLVTALLIVIGVASCDSSTSPDTREGQRIGTFMVYADQMDWVGVQNSAKAKATSTTINAEGDTLFLDQPDGVNLYLFEQPNEQDNFFAIRYQDSSYSRNGNNDAPSVYLNNPLNTRGPALSYGVRSDHVEYASSAIVKCDSSYSESENYVLHYMVGPEKPPVDTLKTVVLNTQGIVEAAKTIKGCNQEP